MVIQVNNKSTTRNYGSQHFKINKKVVLFFCLFLIVYSVQFIRDSRDNNYFFYFCFKETSCMQLVPLIQNYGLNWRGRQLLILTSTGCLALLAPLVILGSQYSNYIYIFKNNHSQEESTNRDYCCCGDFSPQIMRVPSRVLFVQLKNQIPVLHCPCKQSCYINTTQSLWLVIRSLKCPLMCVCHVHDLLHDKSMQLVPFCVLTSNLCRHHLLL